MWRLSAYIAYRAAGGKDSIEKFHPLESDGIQTKEVFVPDKEWWEKSKLRNEQFVKQILKQKHGR